MKTLQCDLTFIGGARKFLQARLKVRFFTHHSKKFLHGKIFICMLHRGHLQENIAEFLICTQLGLIRDVTSLVNEITYL
jgi:hypothetical protein